MTTTTAGDQINGALRLIGQLAEAEEPSAATATDALAALNQGQPSGCPSLQPLNKCSCGPQGD